MTTIPGSNAPKSNPPPAKAAAPGPAAPAAAQKPASPAASPPAASGVQAAKTSFSAAAAPKAFADTKAPATAWQGAQANVWSAARTNPLNPFAGARATAEPSVRTAPASSADPSSGIDAVRELVAARGTAEAARAEVKRLDAKLASDMASLGPGLTPAQEQAYIQGFHAKNQAAYDAATQATERLAQTMDRNQAALKEMALTDPTASQEIANSMKVVAQSGNAQSALTLADSILKDPRAAQSFAFGPGQADALRQDVLKPALAQTASSLLLKNNGDPKAACAELQQLTAGMTGVQQGLFPGADGAAQWNGLMGQLRDVADGKPGALAGLADSGMALGGGGEAAVSIGLVFGAAQAGADAGNPAGEFLTTVNKVASYGSKGIQALAFVTHSLDEAGKLAALGRVGQAATNLSSFGSRLLPGLGVIASAASLALRADKIDQNGLDAGQALGAIGDLAGFIGSVASTIPGGQVIGTPLGIVGGVFSGLGDAISGMIQDGANKDRRREILGGILQDPQVVDRLVNADAGSLKTLVDDLKVPPEKVQDLLTRYPRLLDGTGHGVSLEGLKMVAGDFRMTGDQVAGLLDYVGRGAQNPEMAVAYFLNESCRGLPGIGMPQWIENVIRPNETMPGAPEDFTKAFQNAEAYLKGILRSDERYRWDPKWQ